MALLRSKGVSHWIMAIILAAVALSVPGALSAKSSETLKGKDDYWDVDCQNEVETPHYDSILYCQIGPRLHEIEQNSNRIKVDVIGQSAGGRDLYLVTLSDPEAMGRLGRYQAIRHTMLEDPEKAQAMIEELGDFKVPVFINGSIHGDENPGVDAAMRLIEKTGLR